MHWTYDAEGQSLYVELGEGQPTRYEELGLGVGIDRDAEGVALGVEVLRTWADWDVEVAIAHLALTVGDAEQFRRIVNNPMVRMRPHPWRYGAGASGGVSPGQTSVSSSSANGVLATAS